VVTLTCQNGSHAAAHRIIKSMLWFTFFFIPVVPLGAKYSMACVGCGFRTALSKPDAMALLGDRAGAATTSIPAAPATAWAPVPLAAGGASVASQPLTPFNGGPVAAPTTPGAAAVGPGWFPDPGGGAGVRWWDGSAWTGDTQPQV